MLVRIPNKNKLSIDFAALVESKELNKQANDMINNKIDPLRQDKEILPRECYILDQRYRKGEFDIMTTANFDYRVYSFYYDGEKLSFKGVEGDFRK